jgi:hypothetical protein
MTAPQHTADDAFFSNTNPVFIALLYMHMRSAFRVGSLLDAIDKDDFEFTAEAKQQQLFIAVSTATGQMVSSTL